MVFGIRISRMRHFNFLTQTLLPKQGFVLPPSWLHLLLILTLTPHVEIGLNGVSFAAGLQVKKYRQYAEGAIENPVMTELVQNTADCSSLCIWKLVCSAFSVTVKDERTFECKIALGDFTWTAAAGAKLFMEDIGPLNGYTLTTDGRFHKFMVGFSAPNPLSNHRQICHNDGGNLVIQYPKFRRNALMQLPYTNFFITGMMLTSDQSTVSASGRWVTDDGHVFISSNANVDPDQTWENSLVQGQTWAPGGMIQDNRDKGWYFYPISETKFTNVFCRRDNIYRRMPKAGPSSKKYYKMHYQKAAADIATKVCASEGGTLANVYKQEEWDAIEGYRISADAFPAGSWQDGFLIGGTATGNAGNLTWVLPDGSNYTTNTSNPSQHWLPGEPNDLGYGTRNLMYMPRGGIADLWADSTNAVRFLCEIIVP